MSNVKVNSNERSWTIELISEINKIINKYDLKIKKTGGEITVSTSEHRMFPDVVLYGDDGMELMQGWEIKMPDTLITNNEFINDAQKKAKNLGLNSTIIWNFSSVILYVDEGGKWIIQKTWNENSHIKKREDVLKYQDDWKSLLEKIILDINEFLETGKIIGQRIGRVVTDSLMANIITNNKNSVEEKLKEAAISNRTIEAYINQWWKVSETEYINDEKVSFIAYSKMLILNWLNKFLFAHIIKRYQAPVRKVDEIRKNTKIEKAIEIFEEITKKCDFYGIFCKVNYNEIIDDRTWGELIEYNMFLESINLKDIDQAHIQDILEQSIASSKRLIKGQYTTPRILSEILCSITIKNLEEPFMDCCCGTGTIAKAGLSLKKEKIGIEKAVATTWASDNDNFPLQLTTITLSSIETINKPMLICNENVLTLKPGKKINIIDPEKGKILEHKLPEIGTICSNLPFIAFERLGDKDKKNIEEIINKVKNESGITLNKRGDFYMYIPFVLHDLLKTNGRIGVITSNSWFGTESGKLFYKALKKYFYIRQLHVSGNKKWFNNANVVTVILILEKKEINQTITNENTSFFVWKKNLKEFEISVEDKEQLINNSILDKDPEPEISSRVSYTDEEQTEILKYNVSINSLFHDVKWLLKIKGNVVVPIQDIFEVFRGSRRGWDELFYPSGNHLIEEEYIKKGLKNAQNIKRLQAETDTDVFCCSKAKSELKRNGHNGALNWINKFANEVNKKGEPLPKVLSRKNMYWYEMKTNEVADFFTMMNPDKRFFFGKFSNRSFINQRLIGLRTKKDENDKLLLHALLNSIFSMYYIEALGFGRGQGVLDINRTSIASMYMLNPSCLSSFQIDNIKNLFNPILKRDILDYQDELEKDDRKRFDEYILECYDLSNIYSDIKKSFLSMYKTRKNI